MEAPSQVLRRLWADTLHWAALYLPLVLMFVLALASWWLARQSPMPKTETLVASPAHEPDYFLNRFASFSFDKNGDMSAEIRGAHARHYPDTDVTEIDEVRSRNVNGSKITYGQAKRAYSNSDGSELQYVGQVEIVRKEAVEALSDAEGKRLPQLQIQGEFLHFFERKQQIKSHLPVTLRRGQDEISGDSLNYDHLEGIIEISGRVKASLYPKKS